MTPYVTAPRARYTHSPPYAPAREVEDLRALIAEAYVYGISSGAALALRAAATGPGITRLAL